MLIYWSEKKGLFNIKKHGVSFKEARTVFFDEYGKLIYDPDHSIYEDRFILLGLSLHNNLLTVAHTYKENEQIRIISARKATRLETKNYEEK